jgi:voltage-gated potassium channel
VRLQVTIRDTSWADVVITLMKAGIGTALGYENTQGEIVTQPKAKLEIQANSLIVMVDDDNALPDKQSLQALFTH